MQRGYFSLLLEDHYPQVYPDQKYVYSSLVERLSSQEQVINHLKFAFEQVKSYDYIASTIAIVATYLYKYYEHSIYAQTKETLN